MATPMCHSGRRFNRTGNDVTKWTYYIN